jgi:hypothetical protein
MLKSLQDKFANLAQQFYDRGTGLVSALSTLFKLSQLSSWLSRRLSKPAGLVGIESFVAVCLSVYSFWLFRSKRRQDYTTAMR